MAFLAPLIGVAAGSAGATAAGAAVAAIGVGLIGAGVSAYGQVQQGKAMRRESEFQSAQEANQAVIAQYNARLAQDDAEAEANKLRDVRIRNVAAQQAQVAASGLTFSGSAIDVARDSVIESEKDIAMAKYRGEVTAYNYGTQASSLLTQSTFSKISGRNRQRSANLSAVGTSMDGLSRAGSGYFSTWSAAHG